MTKTVQARLNKVEVVTHSSFNILLLKLQCQLLLDIFEAADENNSPQVNLLHMHTEIETMWI